MSKVLILMRHAKSDWDDPLLEDHARPLNERGRIGASEIGHMLRTEKVLPDQVISSDAVRTRETVALLGLENIDTTFTPKLYHASSDAMMDVLKSATGGTVMLVGHNPGIADFAARLVKVKPQHPRFDDYPTSATLFAKFNIENWADLKLGTGLAMAFAIPTKIKSEQPSG